MDFTISSQGCGMRIRMDPHSFYLLDPGSAFNMRIRIQGGKFRGKKLKSARKFCNNCSFI